MEKACNPIRPDQALKEGSTRMVPNFNVPRWVCSESEEGGELNHYVNKWVEES
jgi:hypothetical protein